MAREPGKYDMEPREAELPILFSDVRGFTAFPKRCKADELREYINEYLTTMSAVIRGRLRGTLDKYIGDAIMAFWGAPHVGKKDGELGLARLHVVLPPGFAAIRSTSSGGTYWPKSSVNCRLDRDSTK